MIPSTFTHFIFRDIGCQEEITVQYNDLKDGLLDVSDVIGGCFSASECKCGYAFCCGTILCRLLDGTLTDNDAWFFPSDMETKLCIYMNAISVANALYMKMYPGWKRGMPPDVTTLEKVVTTLKDQDRSKQVVLPSTLIWKFNTYVPESACIPQCMKRIRS